MTRKRSAYPTTQASFYANGKLVHERPVAAPAPRMIELRGVPFYLVGSIEYLEESHTVYRTEKRREQLSLA